MQPATVNHALRPRFGDRPRLRRPRDRGLLRLDRHAGPGAGLQRRPPRRRIERRRHARWRNGELRRDGCLGRRGWRPGRSPEQQRDPRQHERRGRQRRDRKQRGQHERNRKQRGQHERNRKQRNRKQRNRKQRGWQRLGRRGQRGQHGRWPGRRQRGRQPRNDLGAPAQLFSSDVSNSGRLVRRVVEGRDVPRHPNPRRPP
jgi:hypothetical protein